MNGKFLDGTLSALLAKRKKGDGFPEGYLREEAKWIRQKLCYVAKDYEEELLKLSTDPASIAKKYDIFDKIIEVSDERFRIPEILFGKVLDEIELERGPFAPIHEVLLSSIMKCDKDIRDALCSNVVLSGSYSLVEGLPERLQKEMEAIVYEGASVKVIALPERKYLPWIGGSILASLSAFQSAWISKAGTFFLLLNGLIIDGFNLFPFVDYDEVGPKIVRRKCF